MYANFLQPLRFVHKMRNHSGYRVTLALLSDSDRQVLSRRVRILKFINIQPLLYKYIHVNFTIRAPKNITFIFIKSSVILITKPIIYKLFTMYPFIMFKSIQFFSRVFFCLWTHSAMFKYTICFVKKKNVINMVVHECLK